MLRPDVHVVHVFGDGPNGGNPAPIVVDAAYMGDNDMHKVARAYGHESGFVLPAPEDSNCDHVFRFWVPNHEMPMCGHATVGAVWLLDRLGRLSKDRLRIYTQSGIVEAVISKSGTESCKVEISQPVGSVEALSDVAMTAQILSALGIGLNELADLPVQNACTSRVKTLVPLKTVKILDGLEPDYERMERLCEAIGSTGLYPYSPSDAAAGVFDARHFPKASGYPEDAATGIAAAALAYGVLTNGLVSTRPVRIRQGRAMGHPSEITVRFREEVDAPAGCWISGAVRLDR